MSHLFRVGYSLYPSLKCAAKSCVFGRILPAKSCVEREKSFGKIAIWCRKWLEKIVIWCNRIVYIVDFKGA